jgi:hypothetical protein
VKQFKRDSTSSAGSANQSKLDQLLMKRVCEKIHAIFSQNFRTTVDSSQGREVVDGRALLDSFQFSPLPVQR